jgi:triosephosphate isomerase (TIM)
MRRKLLVANWKMNGSLDLCRRMFPALIDVARTQPEMVICPPTLHIAETVRHASGTRIRWGVQNVSEKAAGALTGEVSVPMAHEMGCAYAIVGHSERRAFFGESDELVADKVQACLFHHITAIACVGETLAERQAGQAFSVLARQLRLLLERFDDEAWRHIVIAYEPVWAIGTGESAQPEQIGQVMRFIRHFADAARPGLGQSMSLLYGGSVRPDCAEHVFQSEDVDGALVGGASLDVESWLAIYQAACRSFDLDSLQQAA